MKTPPPVLDISIRNDVPSTRTPTAARDACPPSPLFTRGLVFLSVALAATGCGDVSAPTAETLSTDQLLILPLATDAPAPASETFTVANGRNTVLPVLHPDEFNTLFLEIGFPPRCVASAGGEAVAPEGEVSVTVVPRTGAYGFRLGPDDLSLSADCTATATLFFSRWGDLSVADGSSTYLDQAAYAAALDLWREVNPDRWRIVEESAPTGSGGVRGRVEAPGSYVVAAPR